MNRNQYVYPGMPEILINPQYFQEAANTFRKKGFYCDAPIKSREYYQYWEEEHRRCLEGYSVGGMWIPGKYYFYLNYFPMLREVEKSEKDSNKISSLQKKVLDFPSLTEVQYHWHLAKHEAFNRPLGDGNHLVCAKTRRSGWSYQEASEGLYNFNFIKNSKSFYLAAIEGYLTDAKDGILPKVWMGMSHLNKNTQKYWKKNRQVINNNLHKRASYLEGQDEGGYMSEVVGILVDKPRKVRGASGIKLLFEEGGSFPELLDILETARPLVEEAGLIGQIVVQGTGGEKQAEWIEGLETLFNEPEKHNFMAFDNIWGENGANDKLGFFVPYYIGTPGFYTPMGEPDVEGAKARFEKEFNLARTSKNPTTLQKKKAERPTVPSDVFIRNNITDFPIEDLKRQKMIASDPKIQGKIKHGVLVHDSSKGYDFILSNVHPIMYPHKQTDDLTGCVSIVDKPVKGHQYLVVVDPFYKDDAEDVTSLGAAYVYEFKSQGNPYGDKLVAWYVARPTLNTFYMNVVRLAEYYGATIQSESAGGGQGLITYCRQHKKLQLLEYEPLIKDRGENHKFKNRQHFMNMQKPDKNAAHKYLTDWLVRERGMDENGNKLLNLNLIYDLALIEELLKFNDKGNFDRYSAMLVLMWMVEEREYIKPKEGRKFKTDFFSRNLFGSKPKNDIPIITLDGRFL